MENQKKLDERILFIDGYNTFYRMFQKHTAKDKNGDPIGGFVGSVNNLQKLMAKFMPTKVYYVFDGVDAGRRRRSLYPKYKDKRGRKTRTATVILNDELKEQVDNEQYQIALLLDCLYQLPISIIAIDSYEADDIIAYLVAQYQSPEYTNIIASTDKDYLQLINDQTYVWSSQQEVLYTPDMIQEKYNIIPHNFIYMRTLIGDPSDKLKGVKGIGKENIFKLLPELRNVPYRDFWKFWESVENLPLEGKLMEKLKAGKKDAHLMFQLMSLKDVEMSLRAAEALRHQLKLQEVKSFSKLAFKIYCIKHNIESILKYYDSWARPFVTINCL